MIHTTPYFILGLILCITGFLLALSSLSITVYNYRKGESDDYLRFERIIIELVAQLCIIIGFGFIYYNLIKGLEV